MRAVYLSLSKSTMTAALAAGMLALSAGAALAEIRETTIDMSTFTSRCRSMGGTLDTGGTAYIKICKLPGGQTVACDFSTSPAYCDVYRLSPSTLDLLRGNANSMSQDTPKPGLKLDLGGATTVK